MLVPSVSKPNRAYIKVLGVKHKPSIEEGKNQYNYELTIHIKIWFCFVRTVWENALSRS